MSLPAIDLPSRIPTTLTPQSTTPERMDSQSLIHRSLLSVVSYKGSFEAVDAEDSFYVADLGVVYRQFRLWSKHLPKIRPYYAVKCNGDTQVLKLLASLGANFDCASQSEIGKMLSLGVSSDRIIYANTVKHPSYLRFAKTVGVNRMTFDNEDELRKIQALHPDAQLLLRIFTDDTDAACSLSCKFGASRDTTSRLLALAKELGLDVVGVAFHIGSGGGSIDSYARALRDARQVFDEGRAIGHNMNVLDIGGGFEPDTFVAAASTIRASLEELNFGHDVEMIAEPGRFMVAQAFTLATNVVGRRMISPGKAMIYVSDGCYGNLNCVIYDHQVPIPHLLEPQDSRRDSDVPMEASVWGPTCDGIDQIATGTIFPREVEIGDWVYFKNMGAYTLAAATQFNGFDATSAKIHYVCSDVEDNESCQTTNAYVQV